MQREKVIYALRCRGNGSPSTCSECSYYNSEPCCCNLIYIIKDALVLLEEQEARVMTLEEARETLHNEDFVYFIEDIDVKMLVGFRAGEDYLSLSNGDYMNLDDLDEGGSLEAEYGKTFRFWTSRPSKEQMKNAPWLE